MGDGDVFEYSENLYAIKNRCYKRCTLKDSKRAKFFALFFVDFLQ